MRVPSSLASAFGSEFEALIGQFVVDRKLISDPSEIQSRRFLTRSIIPHVEKLSSVFNREAGAQESGLDKYWKESSNPTNLRMAYFLYFMPCNLFRVAAIWSELRRLGYRWSAGESLRAIELGAGPASGACGIAAGEHYAPTGLPKTGNWALIEQDKGMLDMGRDWASRYFAHEEVPDWGTRPFHRTIDFTQPLLPAGAPKFNLWLSSFFLNETSESPQQVARALLQTWEKHLDQEGVVILVEPALKLQSRRLLELRKALLEELAKTENPALQVLLPCLGHQSCGALAAPEDWCHEEVGWWRPPYMRHIDQMAGLDRKTLPFSYLVLIKSRRPREEILPGIAQGPLSGRHRLVSPSHSEGRDLEFFICGQEGKRRARYRPIEGHEDLGRGDILLDAEIRGDVHASRIQKTGRANPSSDEENR